MSQTVYLSTAEYIRRGIDSLTDAIRSDSFILAYAKELNTPEYIAMIPSYENFDYCLWIAYKMVRAVAEYEFNADWYRDNAAMRRAGKKFGCKTSTDFRNKVKALWSLGWLFVAETTDQSLDLEHLQLNKAAVEKLCEKW